MTERDRARPASRPACLQPRTAAPRLLSPRPPPIRLRLRPPVRPVRPWSAGEADAQGEVPSCCRAMHRNGDGDGSLVRRLRRLVSRCTRAAARTGGDVNSRAHAEASELAFEFSSTKIMRKENMPTMDGLIDEKSFKEAVLAFSIWADGRAL